MSDAENRRIREERDAYWLEMQRQRKELEGIRALVQTQMSKLANEARALRAEVAGLRARGDE